jgi:beta-lactamase regulating signal transducer with metallopeptidase domain
VPVLTLVWLAGVVVALLRVAGGLLRMRNLTRQATPVIDWAWSRGIQRAAESLHVATPIALCVSGEISVPMTWAVWGRALLLLPAEADSWSSERRRAVLLHELAHVRRRDSLVRLLAQASCALQWFNPLAHLAFRRLRAEQEHACDDLVLTRGIPAVDYATHLVEIARASCRSSFDDAALAMVGRTDLEERVFAILDSTRRRDAASFTGWIAAAATIVIVVAVGTLRLSGAQGQTGAAPAASAQQTLSRALLAGGLQGMDSSQPAWTRTVDEETRGRVAGILQGLLSDGDGAVRDAARQALDAVQAVPAGTVLISSPCRGNCVSSDLTMPAAVLFEMQARLALVEIARQDRESRLHGAWKLIGRTESSAEALARLLQDDDPQVRTAAAIHLDSVVFPAAVPGWIALLSDRDESLRERAAISLGAIGDPAAIDALEAALANESSSNVRRQAARSLGLIAAGG